MCACKTAHSYLEEEISFRNIYLRIVETCNCVCTSGTTDENLAFVLAVEVEKIIACHESWTDCKGAGESSFLIAGEKTLNRSVLDILRSKNCERYRHTDTIVSTKRCALGLHPFSIDISLYCVLLEIEINIAVLLAYHIHV